MIGPAAKPRRRLFRPASTGLVKWDQNRDMKNRLAAALLIASLGALALQPQTALACTPPPGGLPTYTVAQHVQASQVVLEGIVAAVVTVNYSDTASVKVLQYIKGSGPAQVDISGFGPDSMCLSEVKAGDHLIFLASVDSASGKVQAFYLSQFDAVLPADDQTIAAAVQAAIQASDQTPVVIGPPNIGMTQAAAATAIALTLTAAPAGTTPQPPNDQAVTEAWATTYAAATLYPTDPAASSLQLTQADATLEAAAPRLPSPTPALIYPPAPTPAAGPVSLEAVGLLGIGVVIGLILGGLIGIVLGIQLGRPRG
jgi:hypothetical protein